MRLAFARYSGVRGFTPAEFRQTASEVAGADLGPWFKQALETTNEIDYTPALKQRARTIASQYVMGPVFSPPSVPSDQTGGKKGTLVQPGAWGSANWNTGAFDPETGYYYAMRDQPDFGVGVATLDHGALHFEARYNDEAPKSTSIFAGWKFHGRNPMRAPAKSAHSSAT